MVDALLTITVQSTAAINMQIEASKANTVARTKVMDVLIRPLEPPSVSQAVRIKRPTYSTNTAAEVIVPRKRR
jgi:hypothetical protein